LRGQPQAGVVLEHEGDVAQLDQALNEVRAGDLILVKGSRSVETDRIVAALKERFALTGVDKR